MTRPIDRAVTASAGEMARLLAAAEPAAPRPLRELFARLRASGLLGRRGTARALDNDWPWVRGVAFDSRLVVPGSLFVAVPGIHADGHDFVAAAAARGATAAIVERPVDAELPQILVDNTRRALAAAAAWWYGDPSREMGIVGITGTDGKTTTSFLAAAVLAAAGISTGLITTAAAQVGSLRTANPEHVTTPEAPQLQSLLRAMVAAGNRAAILETTSHGLALDRVAEIDYDAAVFTNLTHEHLELHGTFEAYRDAKLSLFRRLGEQGAARKPSVGWPRVGIVNADEAAAPLFTAAARDAGARVVTYGEAQRSDVHAADITEGPRSMQFSVTTPRWRGAVELRLAGRFNVHNALAAIALGEALELDGAAIRAALASVWGVPGRMERVDCGQPFAVVVDYAHSPASLEKVLDVLEPMASAGGGGLVAVFGSAGERDVLKRPMMGRVAAERCRLVVVTNEDPRGEDAGSIIGEIVAGARAAAPRAGRPSSGILEIPDRRAAIEAAFERARPGDVVLLAGKGHEQTIIMADGPVTWDERSEAIRALERLGYESEGGAMRRSGGR